MQGLVVVEDAKVSRCCESFICNGTLQYRTSGNTPISQSGIAPLVSLVCWDAQLSQISHLRFGLLPLLPDVHSEPAPHPFIPRHQRPLHIGYSKVTNPTTDEHFYFLHHSADIAPAVSLCKKFQRSLCFVKKLPVFTTWFLPMPSAPNRKTPTGLPGEGLSVLPRKSKVCNYQADRQHNDFFRIWMAGVEGFEPSARGFGDRCSTN